MRSRQHLGFSLLFSVLVILLFPFVFSQLSAEQNATMIQLSQFLNLTASWNISKLPNPCSWNGVDCDPGNSSIFRISVSGYSLSSSVHFPLFCHIKSLKELDFSNNLISSIPDGLFRDCGGIIGLQTLNFSKNSLVGPLPTFVGFAGLKVLDFSYNKMSGNIDSQLNELVSLTILKLSFNNFFGPIPVKLGKSKNLEQLDLSYNFFHGGFPEAILDYENLTSINLSVNRIYGSLPPRIRDLTKLEFLILSSNNFNGEIPRTLSNITTLLRFAAHENNFSGNIPDGITSYVKNLDIGYNRLNGLIPSSLLSQQNLQTVDLSYNFLEGMIPNNLSPSLVRLRLGSNQLSGGIPEIVGMLTNLKYLELDNNNLSGFIPPQLGTCRNLLLLNLAGNKLIGNLPSKLGNLSNLQVLQLQSNELAGEIPTQITELKGLSILDVSWNFLNGSIPPTISNLQTLSNLNLQGNKLSGLIPDSMNSMNYLLQLQLSRNELRSPIPRMPVNLQIALNLSSNLFEGQIPDTLDQLMALEVLDLSNNNFSGEIPEFMTQMASMTHLTLSNNNLSGVTPKFKSWVQVETRGNPYLINTTSTDSALFVKRRMTKTVTIIVAVAAGIFLTGFIFSITVLLSKHYKKGTDMKLHSAEDPSLSQVFQNNLLTSNEIHISSIDFAKAMETVSDPSNVELKTRFSTYYEAVMSFGLSYYVKKLNWGDKLFQLGSREKFRKELEVLGRLSNANVMTPIAYTLTLDSAYLFYEHTPKGTLSDVLHGNLENTLDWTSRYSIAIGVAQGLSFLQGCATGPILLLDLSTKNIFLKSLKEPLIGDIELCKVIDPTKSTGSISAVAGTVGFVPPEYAYTMRITTAGNIYSFGVILLELVTGKPAISGGTELTKLVSSYSENPHKLDQMLDMNISRTSPTIKSQMLAVLKIALACVSTSPGGRPKIRSVLRMLLNAR